MPPDVYNSLVDFAEGRGGRAWEQVLQAELARVNRQWTALEGPALNRMQGRAAQLQDLIDLLGAVRAKGHKESPAASGH